MTYFWDHICLFKLNFLHAYFKNKAPIDQTIGFRLRNNDFDIPTVSLVGA